MSTTFINKERAQALSLINAILGISAPIELIADEREFELTAEEEAQITERSRKNLQEYFAKKEMETAVVETGNDSVFDID